MALLRLMLMLHLFCNSCESKSGMVRDHNCTVFLFAISQKDGALSPLHAELNSILDDLAEARGYEHVQLECDSLITIKEVQNSDCYWWSVIANNFPIMS